MEKTHSLSGAKKPFKFMYAALLMAASTAAAALVCGMYTSCKTHTTAEKAKVEDGAAAAGADGSAVLAQALNGLDPAQGLAAFAEFERSRGFMAGMGLAESALREKAGDHAGATLAAFKELYWTYSTGGMARDEISGEPVPMTLLVMRKGMAKAAALYTGADTPSGMTLEGKARALRACNAALDFIDGHYAQAGKALDALSGGGGQGANLNAPDDFSRWMRLVCSIEGQSKPGAQIQAEYSAIRARYSAFPAYWYYAIKTARGEMSAFTTEYAERCINLAPDGPYADEARITLAVCSGLTPQDGAFIRTKSEIEGAITEAVKNADPARLEALFPLVSLDDNNWTAYAAGALHALASAEPYRSWFSGKRIEANARRGASPGAARLAGRLDYITRG